MKIERIKIKDLDKNFEVKFSDSDNVICVSNWDRFCSIEFRDVLVFNDKWINDIDTILGLYISGEYFAGEKLDDNKRKEMIEIASNYLKEISPVKLDGEKSLYYKYTPDDVFVDWDIELIDKNEKMLDYYKEREENIVLKLLEFIIVNNVILRWGKNFSKNLNFPIFIEDVFFGMSDMDVNVIMMLIKNMKKQVFILLEGTNKLVQFHSDKTI
jgi:hypothetical protein